jgi:hypothetical protein
MFESADNNKNEIFVIEADKLYAPASNAFFRDFDLLNVRDLYTLFNIFEKSFQHKGIRAACIDEIVEYIKKCAFKMKEIST